MSFSIQGKTAIITGAATGIGHAIARHFLDEGANVVFSDQNEKRLKSNCDDLASSENCRLFVGDLREKLAVANLLSTTLDAFDRVDVLINATRSFMLTDPLDAADDSVETLLDQNLNVALRTSQAVARRMILQAEQEDEKPQEAGTIINISSIAAHRTQPQLMGFSISNAALEQMTRSMGVALAPHAIRVNAIAVGSLMSGTLRDTIAEHPEYRDSIIQGTPLHRIGTASEVAELAQFLASGASAFMTGQVMTLDGGRSVLDTVQRPAH
ncbi:SDR family NAD(P)-dependent oxidoreductase [Pararhodobacter marinus]|uniref:Oxidoreductase n=1 Tax=Pararhodobacter marinus TaxID=2184063 RepID=A0A2U2C7Z8_9RHOB|nr:SDR family oxidoreductase [Pararhodobacter marinus]PWE27914.1 oxidoreductase [Pararhodobacter marinus]